MITADFKFEAGDLVGLSAKLAQAALEGLRDGGEHVLKLARDVVPIEEGTLERSGRVTDDGESTVAVSFDTPYAVRQHEDLTLQHDSGRSAKYLERPAAQAKDDVGRLVAASVRRAAGG